MVAGMDGRVKQATTWPTICAVSFRPHISTTRMPGARTVDIAVADKRDPQIVSLHSVVVSLDSRAGYPASA